MRKLFHRWANYIDIRLVYIFIINNGNTTYTRIYIKNDKQKLDIHTKSKTRCHMLHY